MFIKLENLTLAKKLFYKNISSCLYPQVIQLIPDNWSVGLLSQFLTSSVRKGINGGRTTRVERMLARGENLQVKQESLSLLHGTLSIGDDK